MQEFFETPIEFKFNDGGRAKYFTGKQAGDCVVRAITIATNADYKDVYDDLQDHARRSGFKGSVRNGLPKKIYHDYILEKGFTWVAKMKVGSGCTTHLRACELPDKVIIVRLSKHIACVKNRILNDTYDCSRDGTRCVYGYYVKV